MPFVSPTTILDGRVAYAYVDDVVVTLFDVPRWVDADVVRVMEESTRLANNVVARGSVSQFHGEIFGAGHRRLVLEWLEAHGMTSQSRNALLTDSQVMRGALTAYAWLTRNDTKAFDPHDLAAASAWVSAGFKARPAEVKAAIERCQRLLRPRGAAGATPRR
jgi:hypothetical protein